MEQLGAENSLKHRGTNGNFRDKGLGENLFMSDVYNMLFL
jgi:hypothetical protein